MLNYLIMKNLLFLLISLLAFTPFTYAGDGDTTVIHVYEDEYINWYGNFYGSGVFDGDKDYRKITLKITLGCPSGGCSDWDYSTSLYVQDSTGVLDSNLVDYPRFKVNGERRDTVFISTDTTYLHFFANGSSDSSLAYNEIVYYNDDNNATTPTDTVTYFRGNFNTVLYNNIGQPQDTIYFPATDTLVLTTFSAWDVFEILDDYEIGRIITPYGGYWSQPREHTYEYDITDYQWLLDGDMRFKYFYGGWSSGWNLNVEVELIEGTPSRDCLDIERLWHGEYKYGVASQPIRQTIQAKTVDLGSEIEGLRLRSMVTGHSFGGNENCAEFCAKTHEFVINDAERFDQELMRDDCGFNPVFPQNGTWVYNRAGWCPGLEVDWFEYELSDLMDADNSMKIDHQFESYSYNGGASYDPNYRIATYLHKYGSPNFTLDAEVTDIISPSTKTAHSRVNPICSEPVIEIKNNGSTELTSLTIKYGVVGGTEQEFEWTGSLAYLETEEVTLDLLEDLRPAVGGEADFYVNLSNPNGQSDEYAANNEMMSVMEYPETMQQDVVLVLRTNNRPAETSYELHHNYYGSVIASSDELSDPYTRFEDTLSLAVGCYTLVVEDTDGDGIDWWANNDGDGYIRFENLSGATIKTIEPDFGSKIIYEFVVDGYNSVSEVESMNWLDVYPNPSATGLFQVDLKQKEISNGEIRVMTLAGKLVKTIDLPQVKNISTQLDLTDLSKGVYLINLVNESGTITKKVIIQ